MATFTADNLVDLTRKAGKLPPHDKQGTDADILELLNNEQRLYLTHLLQSTREQYRQAIYDITTTAGTKRYAIPSRAVAAGVVAVAKVDASGARTPFNFFPDSRVGETSITTPGDCYIEGNELVLYADPGVITLRVTYNRRLSELVLVASARAITAINTGTKTVTVSASPSTFTSRTTMDLVKGTPHFDTYGIDLACSSIGSGATSIVFTATLPTSLAVGDYVCLPGESPVCNAPWELHDVLTKRAAYVWLQQRGDQRAATLKTTLDEAQTQALGLLSPRVQSNSKPLVNFNGPGWGLGRTRRFSP